MSRSLWSGVGLSKPRKKKPEEGIALWAPDKTASAAIKRGDKKYRDYLKRLAAEHDAENKR